MNKAKLKTYAPQARRDFIAAVTARAHLLGLHESGGRVEVAPAERQGDVALIAGQAWPVRVLGQRDKLVRRMHRDGFAQTLEAVAYTWFNRFAALRFMEIHDYLGHGQRVLSSREGGLPEILAASVDLARRGDLATLDAAKVEEMKLAGNQDGELYRLLLVAQCNALSNTVPFLFERIDDETELLLPDNLLRTDSVIAGMVSAIAEEDWAEVEIIGWLYQFYISEKKDAVIGKVVKSEDIPAATQLFTPNWIVQYLVQNSVGRLWLMANPASTLKSEWSYYIEPAEQTPEVNAALAALTQARMDKDGGSLNPESITVLDPACGSGHILVEAYEVLKAIYLERGYRLRDIPRLILEKNLYGLDIDDRAAQMAGFALLMKARTDDRRLLNDPINLNVLSLQESKGLDAAVLSQPLQTYLAVGRGSPQGVTRPAGFGSNDLFPATRPQMSLGESAAGDKPQPVLISLIETFAHAKTFGSLIQISPDLKAALPALAAALHQALQSGDLYAEKAARDLLPLVEQAKVLAMLFDAVVANPPYMGWRYYDSYLKKLVEEYYKSAKGDLYTCFMVRNASFSKIGGIVGMITIPNWMFLPTFEELRDWLSKNTTIETFSHNGRGVFGSDFGSCAFTYRRYAVPEYKGRYKRLFEKQGSVSSNEEINEKFYGAMLYEASSLDFRKIPGMPIAYWMRNFDIFLSDKVGRVCISGGRTKSHNDELYVRYWWEPESGEIGEKWVWFEKGGEFRKWYGNKLHVIDWSFNARSFYDEHGGLCNQSLWWKEGITWSRVTSAENSFRFKESNSQYGSVSPTILANNQHDLVMILGFLNSCVSNHFSKALNPTIDLNVGDVLNFPLSETTPKNSEYIQAAISIARADWNSCETASGFRWNPLREFSNGTSLIVSWEVWANHTSSPLRQDSCPTCLI